ncbi:hypothetical protein [Paenibacillus wenxiniae]|uniref:Uncharacterized protein n=1 Tax=Paenibacillus wenxiniae TaxID=1636843 RepID=A0ABW4RFV5_9BACL
MIGKQQYDHIRIPEQLADTIIKAQRKAAQKQEQRRRQICCLSMIAVCIVLLVLMVNVPTVAKAIDAIRILGSMVNVLQFE